MPNINEVKDAIKKNFPDLKVKEIKYFASGCDNDTYFINKKYLLRYPKHKRSINHIESLLLPKLEKYISIKIPKVIYSGKYKNKSFMIYEPVKGKELDKEIFKKLSEEEKRVIFYEVIKFLRELQSFPIESATECGVKITDFREHFKKLLINARKKIFPRLSKEEIKKVEQIFKEYFNNELNFKYKPSLLHSDLSIDHVFIDKKNKVSGIIDFGDVGIGDPDYDLVYMPDFGNEMFVNYIENIKNNNLVRKLKFYLLTCDINGMIFAKNKDKFNRNLEDLKNRIKTWDNEKIEIHPKVNEMSGVINGNLKF
ncbi:MAG: aminoglycoside phosphotransferase family protein [Nanoarchaeota archaeon]